MKNDDGLIHVHAVKSYWRDTMIEGKDINCNAIKSCSYCKKLQGDDFSWFGGGLVIVVLNLIMTAIYNFIILLDLIRYENNLFISKGVKWTVLSALSNLISFSVFTLAVVSLVCFFRHKERFLLVYRVFVFSLFSEPLVRFLFYTWSNFFNYGEMFFWSNFDVLWYPIVVLCVSFLYFKFSKRANEYFCGKGVCNG